eukprot:10012321-Karenia_brevis.AAC.1
MPGQMCRGGLSSDVISFNAAISPCEKGVLPQVAAEIPAETSGKGLSCHVMSFSAAISACERSGHWQRVAPRLEEMCRGALSPQEVNVNAFIWTQDRFARPPSPNGNRETVNR